MWCACSLVEPSTSSGAAQLKLLQGKATQLEGDLLKEVTEAIRLKTDLVRAQVSVSPWVGQIRWLW